MCIIHIAQFEIIDGYHIPFPIIRDIEDYIIAFVFDGSDGVRSYLQKLKGVFIWVLLFVEAS